MIKEVKCPKCGQKGKAFGGILECIICKTKSEDGKIIESKNKKEEIKTGNSLKEKYDYILSDMISVNNFFEEKTENLGEIIEIIKDFMSCLNEEVKNKKSNIVVEKGKIEAKKTIEILGYVFDFMKQTKKIKALIKDSDFYRLIKEKNSFEETHKDIEKINSFIYAVNFFEAIKESLKGTKYNLTQLIKIMSACMLFQPDLIKEHLPKLSFLEKQISPSGNFFSL